jgi:hypothetical protein
VTGRLKDLIIIRGANYYPQDIEWSVERCHGGLRIGACAAISVDVNGEEQLVIVQEVERRTAWDPAEVIRAIRHAISDEHQIEVGAVVLIRSGSIPKTSAERSKGTRVVMRFCPENWTLWNSGFACLRQGARATPCRLRRLSPFVRGTMQKSRMRLWRIAGCRCARGTLQNSRLPALWRTAVSPLRRGTAAKRQGVAQDEKLKTG